MSPTATKEGARHAADPRRSAPPGRLQIALRLGLVAVTLAACGCATSGPKRGTTTPPPRTTTGGGVVVPPIAAKPTVLGRVVTRGARDTTSLKQAVVYVVDDLETPSAPAATAPAPQRAGTAVASKSSSPTATSKAATSKAATPRTAKTAAGARTAAKPAEPAKGGAPADAAEAAEQMCQTATGFRPRVVAVPAGGIVEFANCDSIYHSVFSIAKTKRFDTGLFAPGKARPVRFERPGVVDIYCQLHARNIGYVVVVPNRHFTRPNAQGEFRLPPLKPGTYTVKVWHPKYGERTQPLAVARDGSGVVSLAY